MKLSPIYLQRLEEKKLEGLEEGKLQGKLEGLEEGKLQGKLEGKLEGKLQGKLEGKLEGQVETLRANIISILEKRFQTIPTELVSQINTFEDTVKLQQLHLETISVNSLAEFQSLI